MLNYSELKKVQRTIHKDIYSGMSSTNKSKLYITMIINFVCANSDCTLNQISDSTGIKVKSLDAILRRLKNSGEVLLSGKVRGNGTKYAYTYKLPEVDQ